jgi:hypothetical protein
MRALLALAALLSASVAHAQQPLTFWRYAGDPVVLQAALDCAIPRWRAATCLPIDVSYYAAHWVRTDIQANMNGLSGLAWGNNWSNIRIKFSTSLTPEAACQVLVHEIGHVLRRNYGHPCAPFTMCHPSTSTLQSVISEHDLSLVCAAQPCACFNPEQ